ncbi:MAG: hypothetical protein SFW66_01245 [Gammaproteobacteria bacterium]|nr:hypothetical protein [Gammaproteobacteria bacterium]
MFQRPAAYNPRPHNDPTERLIRLMNQHIFMTTEYELAMQYIREGANPFVTDRHGQTMYNLIERNYPYMDRDVWLSELTLIMNPAPQPYVQPQAVYVRPQPFFEPPPPRHHEPRPQAFFDAPPPFDQRPQPFDAGPPPFGSRPPPRGW